MNAQLVFYDQPKSNSTPNLKPALTAALSSIVSFFLSLALGIFFVYHYRGVLLSPREKRHPNRRRWSHDDRQGRGTSSRRSSTGRAASSWLEEEKTNSSWLDGEEDDYSWSRSTHEVSEGHSKA